MTIPPLPVAAYSIAASPWPVELGHHRAVVHVDRSAPAVRVRIPWRRRDRDPQAKATIVVNRATGKRVANTVRITIAREYGDLAFEAATAGDYEVYYLPYRPEPVQYYYGYDYTPPTDTADPAWLQANSLAPARLESGAWRKLPEATVTGLQARTEFDSFYPMEVVADGIEVAMMKAGHPGAMLLFPEDRKLAIRMPDDLPVRWIEHGPSNRFAGTAQRNEFYPFQVGVFAARGDLEDLRVQFGDLVSAAGRIPASALRCFNTGGIDTFGRPFTKRVDVPADHVQALWIGVDVPKTARPGRYTGALRVLASGQPPAAVQVELTVEPGILADRGDGDLWRLSRLRWLDSPAGLDDEVVAPYTPLRTSGRTVGCLGRSVRFGEDGMPAAIRAGKTEILAQPMRLALSTAAGPVRLPTRGGRIVHGGAGKVAWEASGEGSGLSATCRAEMEFDGHVAFRVALRADSAIDLADAALEIPLRSEVARYFMGAGRKGGRLPADLDWKWTGPFDSFWIGDVPAGLHCELRGGAYNGPLMNLFHPAPPESWSNGGKGGVTLVREAGAVVVRAYTGSRRLESGQELTFEFALIPTPVKPLDRAREFRTRYYHGGDKPVISDYTRGSGINIINIHHANPVNPYINYPFRTVGPLRDVIHRWQGEGMKVKIYYTVRELSNYMEELWVLRSLGTEVLAGGPGGGFPWLREHLGGNYTTQWYVPFPDGSADAALLNSGESRWYNYYIEGLAWLCRNLGMDGLYLDDVSYDRHIVKRMRKVMAAAHPGAIIDLHSNTGFSIGPANQYMEYMPYVDRLWFGESFRYNQEPPDYWLVEASGIPFGVGAEMLQSPVNAYRGMIYGITNRITWDAPESGEDPRPIFRLWDAFGIDRATMRGYWDPKCPIKTDREDVLATAYVRKGKVLVALASWADDDVAIKLKVDWAAIGLDPAECVLKAPAVRGVQEATEFAVDGTIPVAKFKGWMLVLERRAAR